MDEKNLTVVLNTLAEKISALECDVYLKDMEIKRLKEALAKKEAEK